MPGCRGGSGRLGALRAGGVPRSEPCPGQEVSPGLALEGSWHRLRPPALRGLAELARLLGPAGSAVCLGLSASREGAGSWNGRGGLCAEEGPAWQIASGSNGGPARCQVWAWGLRRECEGAGEQGLGEVAQWGGVPSGGGVTAKALLGSHRLHIPPLPPVAILFFLAPDFRQTVNQALSCVLASASFCPI